MKSLPPTILGWLLATVIVGSQIAAIVFPSQANEIIFSLASSVSRRPPLCTIISAAIPTWECEKKVKL